MIMITVTGNCDRKKVFYTYQGGQWILFGFGTVGLHQGRSKQMKTSHYT